MALTVVVVLREEILLEDLRKWAQREEILSEVVLRNEAPVKGPGEVILGDWTLRPDENGSERKILDEKGHEFDSKTWY